MGKRRSIVIFLVSVVVFIFILGTAPLFSESGIFDRIGIIPEHGFHGAVPEENIDLFTGNLTLRFQDIRLPGPNGFDVVVWRVYNSKIMRDRLPGSVWGMQQEPYSFVGLGWSMHMGRIHGFHSDEPVIEFPDGRWETAYPGTDDNYHLTRNFAKYDRSNYKLYFKDGTIWTFGLEKTVTYLGSSEQVRVVTQIENTYGHTINIEYQSGSSPELLRITDSMNRTINFVMSNNRLSRIYVKNTTGAIVNYYYTVGTFPQGGYYQLTQYNPPEIPASTYEYYTGQYDHYELTAVNTGFGGRMEYDHTDHTFYYQVQPLQTRVVSEKRIRFEAGGPFKTWSYTYPNYLNTPTGTTAVDGPVYDTSVTYHAYTSSSPWKIGLMNKKWFDDDSYSEEIEWTYQQISYNIWKVLNVDMGTIKAPLVQKNIVTRKGDANSSEEYLYERSSVKKYGLPTKIKYYGGTSGTTLKNYKNLQYYFEINSTFANKYMLSHIYKEETYDAGGSKLKESQTNYYAVAGKYGAIDQIKQWKEGSVYLTWDYTYTSTNPNSITITIDLPGAGGTETHKYSYGVLSELTRPGYTELTRTISSHNSAVLSETNQHGGTMGFTYDNLDRITIIDMPTGFNNINAAWSDNDVTITQGGNTVKKYWDGLGRDTGYTESGDGITLHYRKTRDAEGRLKEESKGSTNTAHKYTYLRNAAGNPTTITDPRSYSTTIEYDGYQKTVTDARTHKHYFYYENLPGLHSRLKDPENRYANFTYDGIGRVTQITYNSARTQTYSYNGLDQVKSESHPETGLISYTYNLDNNLWTKTWGGTIITYTYNTANQLRTLDDGDETITYTYDTKGRVNEVSGAGWMRDQITYNLLGSIKGERQTTDGLSGAKSLDYTYDNNNNPKSVTYPDGKTNTCIHNGLNMPETMSFSSKSLVSQVVYGIHKKPMNVTISGNNTTWNTIYNSMGFVDTTSWGGYSNGYGYDEVGNVTSMNNAAPDMSGTFFYDKFNRLYYASYSGVNIFQYTYDKYGNMEEAKENGKVVFSAGYNNQNRVSGGGYGYDSRGNITAAPGYTNTWDNQNRLVEVKDPTAKIIGLFVYNERGLRLKAGRDIPPTPQITVLTPTQNDTWYFFTSNEITWETVGYMADKVNIYIYQGNSLVMEIEDDTANDGSYTWDINNSPAPGQYTIRIRTVDEKVEGIGHVFNVSAVPPQNPFSKITSGAIVTDVETSYGSCWGDYNDDGYPDLYVSNYGITSKNHLYKNNGSGTFTKITSGAAVTDTGYSMGSAWADYDKDGFMDLFVPNNKGYRNFLYKGDGSDSFTRINNNITSINGDSWSGNWVDYNYDGHLDLFVCNRKQNNYLFENNGDGSFTRITSGDIVIEASSSVSSSWCDYDNDGDPDLFIATSEGQKNHLYRNDGDGVFEQIFSAGDLVTDTVNSSGGAWGDYNNDGHMDIFASNMATINYLYRNNGDKTFTRVDFPQDDTNSRGAVWGDFDNDSDLDLYVANRSGFNLLYMNDGYGHFEKITTGPVATDNNDSQGSACADIDGDGDLDLFVANSSGGQNCLYRNDNENNGNHWIGVRCQGVRSNASAIGAKVRVKAVIHGHPVWQMREISSHTSYMSQGSLDAHFGIADAAAAEEIHVEWPSGNVQVLNNVAADQYLTITEVDNPAILVRLPNGGEHLVHDAQQEIKWSSHLVPDTENVTVEYSTDDGSTYTGVGVTSNNGSYQWTVPHEESSQCKVRVKRLSGPTSDESNAPFSISVSDTPYLELTTPNGGEQWEIGSTKTIAWSSMGVSSCITIEYSTDNGGSYETVILCAQNTGSFDWVVPNEVSSQCLVQIREYEGTLSDVGDGVFSIVEPSLIESLTLNSPNGGEEWEVGSVHSITWASTGSVDNIKIEYSIDSGATYSTIAESTPNDGICPWTVPDTESFTCLVRISEAGGGEMDESDGLFSITEQKPRITLLTPNGGENWRVGTTQYITWTSDPGIYNVKIRYTPNDGARWDTILLSTANDGTHQWVVPDTPSSQCRVEVLPVEVDGWGDTSFGPFAITATVENPFTKITTGEIVNDGGRSNGCCWGDYDNDDYQDLFVSNWYTQDNFLYRNNGDGTFTKIIVGPLVTDGGYSLGSTWGDYDHDDDPDLFVPNNEGHHNFLYKNNGDGSFTKINSGIVVSDAGNSWAGSWVDFDNDRDLDLFVVNKDSTNFLYQNDGNDNFSKITTGELVTDVTGSVTCAWSDYDHDFDLDVYIANSAGQPDCIYENMGDGTFMRRLTIGEVVTDEISCTGGSWGDMDNDGDMDLFVSTMSGQNYLYQNAGLGGGAFFKVSYFPADEANSRGAVWADFDNDGDQDLFVANRNGTNFYYRNDRNGFFTRLETGAVVTDEGDSLGATCADIDRDGDLDLFVANGGDGNNFLYLNNSESNGNNWISIRLIGTGSNRSAIGARIEMICVINQNGVKQGRQVSAQSSYLSQDGMWLHFGMGDATVVSHMGIYWPSGNGQVLSDVPVNQFLTVYEDTIEDSGEIKVMQDETDIPTGGTYHFPSVPVGSQEDVVFTIENQALSNLTLYGSPLVEVSGADAGEFEVVQEPEHLIMPAHTTSFTVRFTPTSPESKSAQLTIVNTDPDENPFVVHLFAPGAASDYDFSKVTVGEIVSDGGNSYACSWADYDHDGFQDLFVGNKDENNALYKNNGDGTFTKIVSGAVVTDGGCSSGSSWGDYDNDGFIDLFVVNHNNENNFLYRNNGDGSFTKVTTGVVVSDSDGSNSGAWVDYDMDGFLDLFVVNQGQQNRLYRNNGDGSFTQIIAGVIVTDIENSFGCAWGDYDNDGDPDVFVANRDENNSLYQNNGDGTFTKIIDSPVVTDLGGSQSGCWGDFDNDMDLDLFVANWGNEMNFLYINNGDATFTKVTSGPVVTENSDSTGGSWADYDNDGDLDLLVTNKFGTVLNFLYRNNGDGTFTKMTEGEIVTDEGHSQAAAWGNYDNDGDVDLFVVNLNQDNFLYENTGNGNSWVSIRCIGMASNKSGIGTRVKVKASIGGSVVWQVREVFDGDSIRLWFGLGDAFMIDEIQVYWTSGQVQTFTDISVNQFLEITEGVGIQSSGQISHQAASNLSNKKFLDPPFSKKVGRRRQDAPAPVCTALGSSYAANGISNSDRVHGSRAPVENSSNSGYNESSSSGDSFGMYNYVNYEKTGGPNMGSFNGGAAPTASSGVPQSTSLVNTYYIYSFDGKLMAEYDHDGNCVKDYIYMGNKLIAEYQPQTGKYYYYVSDQINSTRQVLDDNGDVVHSTSYGPYGKVLATMTNTYEPKLKYSGKEREGYSDLDYFGARYYDHQSYRFNSVDPIINKAEALTNPQLWNLYSYCKNNPFTFLDPDGQLSMPSGLIHAGNFFMHLTFAWSAVWHHSRGMAASKYDERGCWIYSDGSYEMWGRTNKKEATKPDVDPAKPLAASAHRHTTKMLPEPQKGDSVFVYFYETKDGKKVHRGKPLFTVHHKGVWMLDPNRPQNDPNRKRKVLEGKTLREFYKNFKRQMRDAEYRRKK